MGGRRGGEGRKLRGKEAIGGAISKKKKRASAGPVKRKSQWLLKTYVIGGSTVAVKK